MRRRTGVLVLVALSVPAISQAPDPDARLRNQLTGKLRDEIVAIVDSARRANLPTEPLIDRALEGVFKKQSKPTITDAAIIASVRSTARDLDRAKRALGPSFTNEDVTAGMHAIRAGVDIKQLERLRAARSGQRIATAINVLDYLVLLRLDPDTAANVIVGLVLASATDEQLMSLKADIERDLGAGTPASSAMTVRGEQLAALIAAGAQNNGGVPGSTLPSGIGSTRPADPAANAALGGGAAAGQATQGGSKPPAPAGKPAPKKP